MERQDNRTRNNPVQTLLIGIFTLFIPLINYPAAPEQTEQKHSLMFPLLTGTTIIFGTLYKSWTKPTDKEALIQACYKNDLRTVNSLLQKNVDLDCHAPYGESPLHIAGKTSNPQIIRALLDADADIHAQAYGGETPFTYAVARDYMCPNDSSKKSMQILLDGKADINQPNGRPLITTVLASAGLSTVEFLLRSGADYTLSENGLTAEQLIKKIGKPGMREALNQRKKDDKEKVSVELQGLFNEQHLVATTHGGILAAFYGLPNPD